MNAATVALDVATDLAVVAAAAALGVVAARTVLYALRSLRRRSRATDFDRRRAAWAFVPAHTPPVGGAGMRFPRPAPLRAEGTPRHVRIIRAERRCPR